MPRITDPRKTTSCACLIALSLFTARASADCLPNQPVVTIVGGGIGSVAAADQARLKGYCVQIFTDEDHLGGRVGPVQDPYHLGLVSNPGAEFVDTQQTEILGMMKRLGIPVLDNPQGATTYIYEHQQISKEELSARLRENDLPAIRRLAADQKIWKAGTADSDALRAKLSDISISQYLDQAGASDFMKGYLETLLKSEEGRTPDRLAASLLQDYVDFDPNSQTPAVFSEFHDEEYHVTGGTYELISKWQNAYHPTVNYGYRLVSIQSSDQVHYTLVFQTPDHVLHTVQTEHFVNAVPFSSLRNVDIEVEGMPAPITEAIKNTTYGSHGKLFIYFKDRPWLKEGKSGSILSTDSGFLFWDSSLGQTQTQAGSLTAYIGDLAKNAKAEDLESQALADLERVMPGISKQVVGVKLFGWQSSYSGAWLVGESELPIPSQVGNMLFVGEHVSPDPDQQGYMEGAARSGRSALDAIEKQIHASGENSSGACAALLSAKPFFTAPFGN